METIEIRDIQYVLAVCEEGSFSRAAERCYISQPALSKIVKKVEKNLETVLFDRSSLPLTVTPEGEIFIDYFRRIQSLYREMEQQSNELRKKKTCDVRIGAPSFFCTYVLPPMLSAFRMDHPDFRFRLMETNDSDLRRFLRSGIVDLGISVEASMTSEFDSFVLQEERILLAVPRQAGANRGLERYAMSCDDVLNGRFRSPEILSVPMEAFAGENFLFLKQGNDMYRRGMRICRDAGFEPNVVMELDQLMTAYYLADAGEGITFMRAEVPCYAGPTENLVFYKFDHPDMVRQVRVFLAENAGASEKKKLLMEYIRNFSFPARENDGDIPSGT